MDEENNQALGGDGMSLKPIISGALGGLVSALGLAAILALIEFQLGAGSAIMAALVWIGSFVAAGVAGVLAGRMSEALGLIHGAFAGVTMNLVGTVLAETFHVAGTPHIGLGLTVAVVAGLVGGAVGSATV